MPGMTSPLGDELARAATALLDALPQAAVLTDARGAVRIMNRPARRLFGVGRGSDGALQGADLAEVLFGPRERGAFQDVLGIVLGGGSWEGQLTVTPHHGIPQPADLSVRPVQRASETAGVDAGADSVAGALVLVTDAADAGAASSSPDRLSERLTRLARVVAELVVADSMDVVTKIVVEHMADAAGATVASLSVVVDDETLVLVGMRGGREGVEKRWAAFPLSASTPAGDAVRENRMLILVGDEIRDRYPELEAAAAGVRSIACMPLHLGDRKIGVATLSFPGAREFPPAELEFLSVMSDTCAQAIDRVRVTEQAADRSAKITFLADASLELSNSLDYEATLTKVAQLAVPWFADWCSIALDQDGELRTLAVAHVDPERVEMAQELQRRYPADPEAGTGGYEVLRSGESSLTPDITDEMLDQAIEDPEQRRLFRELNLRSALSVPLKVQDRVFGVITWVAGDGGRRFTADDQVFGEDLALRAAQAIDTARLHSELSDVAFRLQRAVLPADLPHLAGWQMAASYLQAGHSDAGGDFYDVTPLGDGRVAFFVGDVMGRGVTAAAAMAQMRAAIRALVAVEPDPATVMVALDRLFDQYDFQQLVTLVYAVLDPDNDELVVVNAGHPPPLVWHPDGSVDVIEGEPGLLLGAGGEDRTPLRLPFLEGDLLLCYTDGLVERRDEEIETGVKRLADACRALSRDDDLFAWLADVVLAVRDTRRDDDVAVLAVRRAQAAT
jgi:serine phosphatase RsbU (regulator of sigma subunit)